MHTVVVYTRLKDKGAWSYGVGKVPDRKPFLQKIARLILAVEAEFGPARVLVNEDSSRQQAKLGYPTIVCADSCTTLIQFQVFTT